ncbi:MAG: hypothetical protein WAK84_14855 [Candidatus Cybelea sp.]
MKKVLAELHKRGMAISKELPRRETELSLDAGARIAGQIVSPHDLALTRWEAIERYFNNAGLWPGGKLRATSEVAQEAADAGEWILSVGTSCHGDDISLPNSPGLERAYGLTAYPK